MSSETENTAILDLGLQPVLGVEGGVIGGGISPGVGGSGGSGVARSTSFSFADNVSTQSLYLSQSKKSPVGRIIAILALVFGSLGFYFLYANGSFDETLIAMGVIEPVIIVPPPRTKVALKKAIIPGQQTEEGGQSAAQQTSIWSEVKNQGGTGTVKIGPPLTRDQRKEVDTALASPFTYQRYKVVLELSRSLPSGSEILLQGVLQTENFWTRMRALIALADLGSDIKSEDVATALGDTSDELRARFFKRFEKSPCSVGCYYIARASLPHLGAEGRAGVVRVIANEASKIRDTYMVAASFDESEVVRQTAIEWLDGHNVDPKIWRELNENRGLTPVSETAPEAAAVPFDAKAAKKLADTERELVELQNQLQENQVPPKDPSAAIPAAATPAAATPAAAIPAAARGAE
jgi:hypothetical protein